MDNLYDVTHVVLSAVRLGGYIPCSFVYPRARVLVSLVAG